MASHNTDQWYIDHAVQDQMNHHSADPGISFDDAPAVSGNEEANSAHGAYVQCWVWVDDDDPIYDDDKPDYLRLPTGEVDCLSCSETFPTPETFKEHKCPEHLEAE